MFERLNKIKDFLKRKPLTLTQFIMFFVGILLVFAYFGFFRPSLINIGHRITSFHLAIAENAKYRIEYFFDENTKALEQLAYVLSITDNQEKRKVVINGFLKDRSWFKSIDLIDSVGNETLKESSSTFIDPAKYSNVSDYDYFKEPEEGKIFIGNVFTSEKGMPFVTVSLILPSDNSKPHEVLAAQLSLSEISKIISNISVGETGKVYVVDSLGYLIADKDPLLILSKTNYSKRPVVSKVITEKIASLGLDEEDAYINENGNQVYSVGVLMDGFGWGVFAEEPEKDAWASYQKIQATGMVIGLLTIILFIIFLINTQALNIVFSDLRHGREILTSEVEKKSNELNELDKTTKLLIKRDLELSLMNRELDKKIEQLERSEKSLLRAFSDIQTARKKLEDEKDKTEAIINNFLDPIVVLDEKNKITLLNPAAKEILGMDKNLIGTEVSDENDYGMDNFRTFIKPEYKVKAVKDEEGSKQSLEEVDLTFGEQNISYKVITSKVVDADGKYLGVMKIFNDVSREKMLDRLKSEFISIAAHQLRTPLSAIKWVLKMVIDGDAGDLNKEQMELMEKGYKSNERIINLVNDLLNVSRIEEGRFGFAFEEMDFQDIITIVVENYESLIAKNNFKFSINKPSQMPKVKIDKEKIIMVMQNLVGNALKYTQEYGKIEINITIEGKFMRVSVKDNGVGIPKEDQVKLFSKFFRATNVVRMQTEGTGLGLFIAKNIIEKHGGDMFVNSKEGEGTEIGFLLPVSA